MGIQADTRTNRTVRKWAWSPSRRGLTTRSASAGRLHVIAYRATLDVPRELAQFVAKLLLAGRRRTGTRYCHPHPQCPPALPALPRRTRVRAAQPALAHPPARHRQPQQDRRHCPRRTRPHPFRARLHQMKIAEITSLEPVFSVNCTRCAWRNYLRGLPPRSTAHTPLGWRSPSPIMTEVVLM